MMHFIIYRGWRVGVLAMLLLVPGMGTAYSLDLGEMWKSGELWKTKRQLMWDDVPFESVSDTCTRSVRRNSITFGRSQVEGKVMLEWKEGQADVDSGTSTEAPTGKSVEKKDEKAEKEQKKEEAEEAERAKKYGCLCRVTCEIYNRNDHGEISKETFDNSVSSYKTELSRISGAKMSKPRVPSSKSANKVEAFQWETPQGAARLYVSTTMVKKEKKKEDKDKKGEKKTKEGGLRMEYIRLVLAPTVAGLEKSATSGKAGKRNQRAEVIKENGMVWIKGLPMVEQGAKAVALPAQLTRLLMFYKVEDVNLDTISALCDTPDDGCTREWMDSKIKEIAHNYRLKVKEISAPWLERDSYMKEYNSKNRKEKKGEEDVTDTASLDAPLWLTLFAKKKSDYNKWLGTIRPYIDLGTPVVWLVFRGDFFSNVEDARGTKEPHIRLIIGYDATKGKEKIIYTEPWGESGARCTMDLPEAYAATDATYILRQ